MKRIVSAAAAISQARAATTLVASPATLSSATATVTVQWSGVTGAASSDWVASYCVGAPESGFHAWNYVTTCDGWKSGACNMSFDVDYSSYGCNVEFRYYRDPSPYTLIGTSNTVTWTAPPNNTIRQVHIAYGREPQTQMYVSWTTDDGVAPAVLQVGTAPGTYDLPNVTAGESVTYTAGDSCGAPSKWAFPGYFHHALVTELTPVTRYYARPTQGSVVGKEISFVTGKPVGPDVATTFIAYADMYISTGSGAVDTAARVAARVPEMDFLVHIGDLGYGLGDVSVWDTWMDIIEPYASALPYQVSVGNHEYDYPASQDGSKDPSGAGKMWSPPWWNGGSDSGGECGVPTSRRFRTPGNGNGVFWYSFEVGNVHMAMVSSEHDPSPGAPMGDWLLQDLAGVDRTRTPWLLVGIHRPLYETEAYAGDYAVAAGLRGIMEPYLLQYGVDAVLAGHYHSFQRTCALANLTCVEKGGIVHYTTGAAGAWLDDVTLYPSNYIENTILGKYGYSVVSAPNASALRLTFHLNQDDSIGDDVWLHKAA